MLGSRQDSGSLNSSTESKDEPVDAKLSSSLSESELPTVIEFKIFSYLSIEDLSMAMLVSRTWRRVASDMSFWKVAIRRDTSHATLVAAFKANQFNVVRNYLYYSQEAYDFVLLGADEKANPVAGQVIMQIGDAGSVVLSVISSTNSNTRIQYTITADMLKARLADRYEIFYTALQHNNLSELKPFFTDLLQITSAVGLTAGRANIAIQGTIDKNFSFGTPSAGFFINPTLLSVAGNYVSGAEGVKIISLLLIRDASLLTPSDSKEYTSSPGEYGGPAPVLEFDRTERPSDTARDNSVIAFLRLAEFEAALLQNRHDPVKLDDAYDQDAPFVKEYLSKLLDAKDEFIGVHRKIDGARIATLQRDPVFQAKCDSILHVSFLRKYWISLLGAAIPFAYSLPWYATKMLGMHFISIFTTAVVPTVIPIIIGAIVVGLAGMILAVLGKKAYNCIYRPSQISFPIEIDASPSFVPTASHKLQSTYGLLFPRKGWAPSSAPKPTAHVEVVTDRTQPPTTLAVQSITRDNSAVLSSLQRLR